MLWLRLPWFYFSVYHQQAPIGPMDVFLRMDTPQLIMMGDRVDMLEYGQRFYPEQQRAQTGIVAMKWATPLLLLADDAEEFLGIEFENYQLDYWEPNNRTYHQKAFVSYNFPEAVDNALFEEDPQSWDDYGVRPPIYSVGWCELQQSHDGTLRWRWGDDYPNDLYFTVPSTLITQETPFLPNEELLRLVQLDDWPTGGERLIRMHPYG